MTMAMTERCVKGVPLSEVSRRLSAPFPDEDFRTNKGTGVKYLPVEAYLQRLEESFGIFQYDLEVTQPLIVECKGTLTLASTAKITLYDDDHQVICIKSATGGNTVTIVNGGSSEEKPKAVKSDIAAAESEAIKKICERLGIGIAQLRARNDGNFGGLKKAASDTAKLTFVKSPQRSTKHTITECRDENGEAVELVIFEKDYKALPKGISIENFARLPAGTTLTAKGRRQDFRGKCQFVYQEYGGT